MKHLRENSICLLFCCNLRNFCHSVDATVAQYNPGDAFSPTPCSNLVNHSLKLMQAAVSYRGTIITNKDLEIHRGTVNSRLAFVYHTRHRPSSRASQRWITDEWWVVWDCLNPKPSWKFTELSFETKNNSSTGTNNFRYNTTQFFRYNTVYFLFDYSNVEQMVQ